MNGSPSLMLSVPFITPENGEGLTPSPDSLDSPDSPDSEEDSEEDEEGMEKEKVPDPVIPEPS